MPLAFNSVSHGKVAFGFFNIESDMLLLENYFFFSTTFCAFISQIAEGTHDPVPEVFPGITIDPPNDIGDLMGAIHGFNHTGFIGALYRHFPFPENPSDFKQNPKGTASQDLVKALIAEYGQNIEIPFLQNDSATHISLGKYEFDRTSFHLLLDYVWKGGLPQWKEGQRPNYVMHMKNAISNSRASLFKGIHFTKDE